jgi:hypothetical protein
MGRFKMRVRSLVRTIPIVADHFFLLVAKGFGREDS